MKRTNINLTEDDQQAIRSIRQQYGLTNDAAAIRLALALTARKDTVMRTVVVHSDEELTQALIAEGLTPTPLPDGTWVEVTFPKRGVVRFEMPYRDEEDDGAGDRT